MSWHFECYRERLTYPDRMRLIPSSAWGSAPALTTLAPPGAYAYCASALHGRLLPTHPPRHCHKTTTCEPAAWRKRQISCHRSQCPISLPLERHPCLSQLTDHSAIPLKTYSESSTVTRRSPTLLPRNACRTPQSSALLTLCHSGTGTGAASLRSECCTSQTPYAACHQPPTCFAEPSVHAMAQPSQGYKKHPSQEFVTG